LARNVAEKMGFKDVIDMKECLGADATVVSSSVGVALLVASMLEGKTVTWKQS